MRASLPAGSRPASTSDDSGLLGDGRGRGGRVAGEHEHAKAGAAQRGNGCGCIGTQGVAGIEVTGGQVVQGHPKAGDSGLRWWNAAGKRNGEFMEEGFIAEQAVVAFDFGGEAAAGENLHVFGGLPGEAVRARIVHDGVGQRMVRSLLGCRGHAQQIVFRVAGEGVNRRPARVGPR